MTHRYQQPHIERSQRPRYGQSSERTGGRSSTGPVSQRIGKRFDESVPTDIRATVEDLDRVASVAEWTKMQAAERGLPRVVRLCDDLEDVAQLENQLLIRQSPFARPLGQTSMQVIQDGLQDLQEFVDKPEVEETVENLENSVGSIDRALGALQTVTQETVRQQDRPGSQYPPREY